MQCSLMGRNVAACCRTHHDAGFLKCQQHGEPACTECRDRNISGEACCHTHASPGHPWSDIDLDIATIYFLQYKAESEAGQDRCPTHQLGACFKCWRLRFARGRTRDLAMGCCTAAHHGEAAESPPATGFARQDPPRDTRGSQERGID